MRLPKQEITDTVNDSIQAQYTSIGISKTDITGEKELAGAHIQILDEEGNVVVEWDSEAEAARVTGLKNGVTYFLVEGKAAAGGILGLVARKRRNTK